MVGCWVKRTQGSCQQVQAVPCGGQLLGQAFGPIAACTSLPPSAACLPRPPQSWSSTLDSGAAWEPGLCC